MFVGQEVRLTLIKTASGIETFDPVNAQAPAEPFPVVAKFPESVVKPNFKIFKRFYQQDIPSQKDDSDNEQESSQQPLRKKRRYRRNEGPRRQWVLQEEEDYLETMIAQKELGKAYKQDSNKVSSRYEGLPEHNPSHYILLGVGADGDEDEDDECVHVTLLPTPYAVHSFAQPARVQTMSMTEAEQAIANQRSHMTRYMLHGRNPGAAMAAAAAPSNTKARLLGKLKALSSMSSGNADDDDDDIMGDLKFSTRKGAGSRARRELLSSMADGVKLDGDGVMGGAHDAEFGGKRRFLNNSVHGQKSVSNQPSGGATSNDGNAMADDFYQRDVKAEYEEMDYDPNDQFDDDDVDLGEGELNMEGGFADDADEEDEFDDDDDDDDDEEKKAGLATVKGLKDMLAKARGETIEGEKKDDDENGRPSSPATSVDKKESAEDGSKHSPPHPTSNGANSTSSPAPEEKKGPIAVQLDEFGQRVLTTEGVRYEIFLHNKSIAMKKLMKLYNIKKKTEKDRIKKFQAIIKELCIMHKDPVQGNMLVLKQHYSKAQV